MSDSKLMHLVNASVDGELDAPGQAELQQLLDASASARNEYEEMQRMVALVEGMPGIEPPADLRRRILSGIELPAPQRKWLGFLDVWTNFGRAVPKAAQLGIAFVMGAVLTMGTYTLSGSMNGLVRTDQLVGTMATSATPQPIAPVQVQTQVVSGQATLKLVDGDWVIGFELVPTAPVAIDVRVPGSAGAQLRFAISEQSNIWAIVKADSAQMPPAVAFTISEDGGDRRTIFSGSFAAPQ